MYRISTALSSLSLGALGALALAACVTEPEPGGVAAVTQELDDFGCTWVYGPDGFPEYYCPCDPNAGICDGDWTPGPGSGGGGGGGGGGYGDPPPLPPPPPATTSTIFQWSSAGPISDKVCVQIRESADPDTWLDNYLCSASSYGIQWSSAGPIAGMRCTAITEPVEPASHTWNDNYLCLPSTSSLNFYWSSSGAISGRACVRWSETADSHSWGDNYLCH